MFGRKTLDAVRLPYRRSTSRACASCTRRSSRSTPMPARAPPTEGVHEADVLVVALGADYDFDATPGLAEGGNEFYSVAGAAGLGELLPAFSRGPRGRSASAARPSSARRRRARLRCCCTTTCRARRPRRLRDHARDAVRHAGAPVAGHLARAGAAFAERRSSSSRAGGSSSLDRRAAWPCSTTAASCPTTCSSASPSTARPTW